MRAWPPRALRVGPWACGLLGTVAAVLGARAQSPTAAAPAGAAAPDAGAGIELGVRVVPDTVRIGEPFVVAVRVRAPVGAAVRFPAGLDSGGAVEAIDPPLESTNERATATDVTARYRVAAWDLGLQPLTLPPVVVRVGDDSRSVRVGRLTVMVAPVAPAESPSRQARPARPVFATPSPRWWPWMLAAAALVALVLAERARWRRRRPPARSDVVDARAVADAEFAALERLALIETGETGRHATLAADILRRYLARRLPAAMPSLTSAELVAALAEDPRVPADHLRGVLAESDAIRFAGAVAPAARARSLASSAQALVAAIDAGMRASAGAAADRGRAA